MDAILVHKRQHVFTIDVATRDGNHRRFDVGVINVSNGQRRRDGCRPIIFGASQRGTFDRRLHPRVVDSRDSDGGAAQGL